MTAGSRTISFQNPNGQPHGYTTSVNYVRTYRLPSSGFEGIDRPAGETREEYSVTREEEAQDLRPLVGPVPEIN